MKITTIWGHHNMRNSAARKGEKFWGRGLKSWYVLKGDVLMFISCDHTKSWFEKHYCTLSRWVSTRSQNHPWAAAKDKSPDIRTWLPRRDKDKHYTWTSLQGALPIIRTFRLLSQNCMRHHMALDNTSLIRKSIFTRALCYAPLNHSGKLKPYCTVSGKMQTGQKGEAGTWL